MNESIEKKLNKHTQPKYQTINRLSITFVISSHNNNCKKERNVSTNNKTLLSTKSTTNINTLFICYAKKSNDG